MASALDVLRATLDARSALDRVIHEVVQECRRQGVSWTEIAAAAAISKPTALARWKETTAQMSVPTTAEDWDIQPGQRIRRVEVNKRYGGGSQSGIAPSRRGDNVLLFSSPAGHAFDYDDVEHADGSWTFTGEGQSGDQTMNRGNRALLDHRLRGKRLHLFRGGGDGWTEYVGEFEYDTHKTRRVTARDGSGERTVIVFTLRPVR